MTRGRGWPVPAWAIAALGVPALVLAGAALLAAAAGRADATAAAGRAADRLESWFEALLDEAAATADEALAPGAGRPVATPVQGVLADRLEGLAVLDDELDLLAWDGRPVDPPAGFSDPGWPTWTVQRDGVRTRLLARAGPDRLGRLALASFVIDSMLDAQAFERLLPGELRQIGLQIEFLDSRAERPPAAAAGEEARRGATRRLGPAGGPVLATARLTPRDPAQRSQQIRDTGRALAAVAFCALLALWMLADVTPGRPFGWLRQLAAVALGRAALLWTEAPAMLLPRGAGSPSLYGSAAGGGLVGSPADLALTGAALYLAASATARFLAGSGGTRQRRTLAAWAALALAAAVTAVAGALVVSIVDNARTPLLDRPAPLGGGAEPLLWGGVTLALLGAARLWGAGSRTGRRGPVAIGIAFLLLLFATAALVQRRSERLALEQLATQYAPAVLEQSARRELTLTLALREIRERYAEPGSPPEMLGAGPGDMAFRFWTHGELFLSGYKSSLSFYTPSGAEVDSFSFDLPSLEEPIDPDAVPAGAPRVKRELFDPNLAVQQRLLHGEILVERAGLPVGVVVGHVLDEPENLPFLPWSRPYLSVLGSGSPRNAGEEFADGPDYVLYDPYGTVELTTLRRPPPDSGTLREAAALGEAVRVEAGDAALFGLALEDDGGQLHLLLLRAPGPLERLAAAVRLALAGLVVWATIAGGTRLARGGSPRRLVAAVRGSFYRKLLVALLLASVVPLVFLAVILRGSIERRGDAALIDAATGLVGAAQRQVEEFLATRIDNGPTGAPVPVNDEILYWMRGLLGQEIHIYEHGRLVASSKRELFSSGFLPPWLDGDVQRRLVEEGLPSLVARPGPSVPVAYAPVRLPWRPAGEVVVAVPLVLEQQQIARAIDRVAEMILLATVALAVILAAVAAVVARTVARPVRELVGATGRIAGGDYGTRLEPRTRDELADLVGGFNTMAAALARQRADLERRRDYMEALLHHATTGVVSLDPGGRVVTMNPAAGKLLGEPSRAGVLLADHLAASDVLRPVADALRHAGARPGEPVDADLWRGTEARRLRVVQVALQDGAAGSGLGHLVLVDDVTDLMRSNQLAAWAEMARAIAHEIKNPLTPIQLSAEHLQRLLADRGLLPEPQMEDCLETIVKQVRALYAISAEFSAYAKLWALQAEPADPAAFMREALAPYVASRPPGIAIELHDEPAPQVAIDRRVLMRAVINLVENALQALADTGGTIRASVRHDAARDEVVLTVRDDGPGLDEEARQRLFEPYFSTKSSGTGLGLAIARRAVEAHGGRIDVETPGGGGTAFHVRLPVTPRPAPAEGAGEPT